LSAFVRVVGARRAGVSISQSAQLQKLSRTTIFRVYKEWCEEGKTSSMRSPVGKNAFLLNVLMLKVRGQWAD